MIAIRPMMSEDLAEARGVWNRNIVSGKTTAYEAPLSIAMSLKFCICGSTTVSCRAALDERVTFVGFQWLGVPLRGGKPLDRKSNRFKLKKDRQC